MRENYIVSLPRLLLVELLLVARRLTQAYFVLSRQATIDSCWTPGLCLAIERRFPGGSEEDLRDAKAYAYERKG